MLADQTEWLKKLDKRIADLEGKNGPNVELSAKKSVGRGTVNDK